MKKNKKNEPDPVKDSEIKDCSLNTKDQQVQTVRTPEEEYEEELNKLLGEEEPNKRKVTDLEMILESQEEIEDSFSIDDHIRAVYMTTKSIFDEEKESTDDKKIKEESGLLNDCDNGNGSGGKNNENASLYHPMNNIIGSLLQMTMIDCDDVSPISPRAEQEISKEIPKTPKSRLLRFIEHGAGRQKSKLFPREAFASLF